MFFKQPFKRENFKINCAFVILAKMTKIENSFSIVAYVLMECEACLLLLQSKKLLKMS